jgi:tetratricopeptide (TPR) repeat protein
MRALALAFALAAGCGGVWPDERPTATVRSYHGTLVPGAYVSPSAYQHYIRAQIHSQEGRAVDALEELRYALAADGNSAYLRVRIAEELLQLGHVDEAREEIEAALKTDPAFPEGWVALSKVRRRLNDAAGAESALKRAVEADRTCEEAWVELARQYTASGAAGRAEEAWRALVRNVASSVVGHEALARAALGRGDMVTGEAELKRSLELDNTRDAARVELAMVLQGEGRSNDAVAQLTRVVERHGDEARRAAELAVRWLVAEDRLSDARAFVDRIEVVAGERERRLQCGWLRLETQQPALARAIADEELRAGELAPARLLYAEALRVEGRREEAIAAFRRVPSSAAEAVPATLGAARLIAEKNPREALDLVEKLLAMLPKGQGRGADALEAMRVELFERAGEPVKARELLRKALVASPDSERLVDAIAERVRGAARGEDPRVALAAATAGNKARAWARLALLLAEQGQKLDEAERMAARARAQSPLDAATLVALAQLAEQRGKLDDAVALLERADRLHPGDVEVLSRLGFVHMARADRVHATSAFRRALPRATLQQRRVVEEQLLLLENGRLGSR